MEYKIKKHQKGGNVNIAKNDATYVAPLQNPSSIVKKSLLDSYTQTGNVMKALPALFWEKLNSDMPFRVFNGMARLGEKIGLTPNKELWPTMEGTKLSPAQYQGKRMDDDQAKRWKAIKEGRYLGHSWGEYQKGGQVKYQNGGYVYKNPLTPENMPTSFITNNKTNTKNNIYYHNINDGGVDIQFPNTNNNTNSRLVQRINPTKQGSDTTYIYQQQSGYAPSEFINKYSPNYTKAKTLFNGLNSLQPLVGSAFSKINNVDLSNILSQWKK